MMFPQKRVMLNMVLALAVVGLFPLSVRGQYSSQATNGQHKVYLPVVQHSSDEATLQRQADEMYSKMEQFNTAVSIIESYLSVRDDQIVFTSPLMNASGDNSIANELHIDPLLFDSLISSLEQTNQQLQSGEVTLKDNSIEIIEPNPGSISTTGSTIQTDCPGITTVQRRWWGTKIFLNKCNTDDLIFLITVLGTTGGGAAGTCALTGAGAPICGPIAVAIGVATGIGVGYVSWLNSRWGRGVIIYRPLYAPSGQWIWHQ